MVPLREAADELGPHTASGSISPEMLYRARRHGVLAFGPDGMERVELERVKRECRCSVCGTLTLGKLHPDERRYCQPHRGKANAGKSIANRTRAKGAYGIGERERRRRRKARSAANAEMWADPAKAKALRERRGEQHAERRRQLEREKAAAGKVVRSTKDVAKEVGRSPTTVTDHVRQGWAQPQSPCVDLPGRPALLWTDDVLRAYKRLLATHPDGRLQRFMGEPGRKGRSAAEDLSEIVMRGASRSAVRERVAARRALREGLSPGRPREFDRHADWKRKVEDRVDYYERQVCAGQLDAPPALWRICGEVASAVGASQPAVYKAVRDLEAR